MDMSESRIVSIDPLDDFIALRDYCEQQGFKGWDPYDGLNSKVFQAIPFASRSAFLRLCVIQGFKRCPVNLRPLALISKDYNPKGIALCLHAYCNVVRLLEANPELESSLGSKDVAISQCHHLANLLISLRSQGNYHGACWGYNFDWQARLMFYFPKYTPTVVATSFAATALINAYEITGKKEYLDVALTSAEFVLNDLKQTPFKGGNLLSYSPLPNNDMVINATLLGCKLLSVCYRYTLDQRYLDTAQSLGRACCDAQEADGSWLYGMTPLQGWIDSFHTGYNLDALQAYEDNTGDTQFRKYVNKGFEFYITHFFEQDGCPKYFHDKTYPIDIHCPAQLFVTLSTLRRFDDNAALANKVLEWTDIHMCDKRQGYYYYQLKQGISSKISYMRWSNAFMLYALSHYLISNSSQ